MSAPYQETGAAGPTSVAPEPAGRLLLPPSPPHLRVLAVNERVLPWAALAACVASLGHLEEADREHVRRVMRQSGFRNAEDVRRVREIADRSATASA